MPPIVLLVALALGWTAGTALQLRQAELAPDAAVTALAAAGLVLGAPVLLVRRWRERRSGALALLVAGALLGHAATAARAALRLADALPAALEGQDLVLTGVVAELPRPGLTGTRFVFEVEGATLRGQAVRAPARVSLAWFRGPDADTLLLGPAEGLRAGQRWRLPVRLRQPHGHFNPHGFDLELWLFERGLHASGYVRARADAPAVKLAENAGHAVERARQAVRESIERRLVDPADAADAARRAAAGVLAALAVGDQAAIVVCAN